MKEEKTSLITHVGPDCYKVMPFGFQNAGARLMNFILKEIISRNLEVYVDDLRKSSRF